MLPFIDIIIIFYNDEFTIACMVYYILPTHHTSKKYSGVAAIDHVLRGECKMVLRHLNQFNSSVKKYYVFFVNHLNGYNIFS